VLAGADVRSARYSRNGDGRDQVDVTLAATIAQQDELRAFFIAHGYATRDLNVPWALNSTDKLRSYLFYPHGSSELVTLTGRAQ
jgi:hypothetical protein